MMLMGMAAGVLFILVFFIPLMLGAGDGRKVFDTQMLMLALGEAADSYKAKLEVYPADINDLTEPMRDPAGNVVGETPFELRVGDTGDGGKVVDAWRVAIAGKAADDGQTMELRSAGPNMTFGDDDDTVLPLPRASTLEEDQ